MEVKEKNKLDLSMKHSGTRAGYFISFLRRKNES